ncbi:MAG: hypothetical protein R2861_16700 [Desulfobacterales bacterium]
MAVDSTGSTEDFRQLKDGHLIDRYSRHLNYSCISITDRCNLRCIYCHPRRPGKKLRHKDILRYEEIPWCIARPCVALGVDKIRITEGSPGVEAAAARFWKN